MPTPVGKWGDEADDGDQEQQIAKEDDVVLPAPKTTVEGDLKKVVSYQRNKEGRIEKHTRYYKLETRKQTASKRVLERRKWAKFGDSKGLPPGPDASVTAIGEEVYLVLKSKQEMEDSGEKEKSAAEKLKEKNVGLCRYCKGDHWSTKCPYKDKLAQVGKDDAAPPEDEEEQPAAPARTQGGRYVPPSMRGAASKAGDSMNSRENEYTVRVSNLSENTRDEDLKELFRPFGPLNRCYLATDRVTGKARGFGFITYLRKDDAQKAIDRLNGYGYDHLILQVEWAKPPGQ